jgi:hypothetical protein
MRVVTRANAAQALKEDDLPGAPSSTLSAIQVFEVDLIRTLADLLLCRCGQCHGCRQRSSLSTKALRMNPWPLCLRVDLRPSFRVCSCSPQCSADCDICTPVPANALPKYICDAPAAPEMLSMIIPLAPFNAGVVVDAGSVVAATTPEGNVNGEAVGSEKLITQAELPHPDGAPLFFTPKKR